MMTIELSIRCQVADDYRGWRSKYYGTDFGLYFLAMLQAHIASCRQCERRIRMITALADTIVHPEIEPEMEQ